VRYRATAMKLLSDWRMYLFEQNQQRWPDGNFYLLDRGYEHWRGNQIFFSGNELRALGLQVEGHLAVVQDDCFSVRHFENFISLVSRIVAAWRAKA
ncbi:MAG: hypothetical protein ACREMY_10340, partial [bacterium]